LAEHRSLTTYARLREQGRRLFPPTQTIRAVKLYHRQVYRFAYHRPKLALLRTHSQHKRFNGLADFLEAIPKHCPHELFRDSSRASQLAATFVNFDQLLVIEKENFATRTAALVLPAVGDNYLRHATLQNFMLANDSVTLAVEIPIWLALPEIAKLETRHGVKLFPDGTQKAAVTGHIDLPQVRNGAVHILDYKPNTRLDRPIVQLTIYALVLAHLTGLRLFDIKCAWFEEHRYCEFFPRTVLKRVGRQHGRSAGSAN